MTDTTQGQDLPDDSTLFNNATSVDTLEKFENPELPLDLPPQPTPTPEPIAAEKPVEKPVEAKEEAHIPAWRLREESEARRQAERRYEELLARQAQAQPQTPQGPDIFENPSAFVQQYVEQSEARMAARLQAYNEKTSLKWAVRSEGPETVIAARQALEQGLSVGDPAAQETYRRAMSSDDPYDVILQWHRNGEVLRTTGGNISAYREKVLAEALNDPEYQKRVFEAARGQASATGNSVARPVKSQVASSPSLGNIGAGGGDTQVIEPSDNELFQAAVNAKRR